MLSDCWLYMESSGRHKERVWINKGGLTPKGSSILWASFVASSSGGRTSCSESLQVYATGWDKCYDTENQLTGHCVGLGNWRRLGHSALLQTESNPSTHGTLPRSHSRAGTRVEQAVMNSKIGLNAIYFRLTEAIKYVEGRDNVKELYKKMEENWKNIIGLSSEKMRDLHEVLQGKLSA